MPIQLVVTAIYSFVFVCKMKSRIINLIFEWNKLFGGGGGDVSYVVARSRGVVVECQNSISHQIRSIKTK